PKTAPPPPDAARAAQSAPRAAGSSHGGPGHAPRSVPRPQAPMHPPAPAAPHAVLLLRDIAEADVAALLARFGLELRRVADGAPIPGSYWGEPEAGIIGPVVHARGDTPVHSLLHEACHLVVLPPERRAAVHTDATDSVAEEDAVCVLQVLLGDA